MTSSMEICATCKGRGSTVSLITQGNKIFRQIQNKAQTGNFSGFSIYGSLDLINFLQKEAIHLLKELEKEFDIKIALEADKQFFLADEAEIHTEEREGGKKSLVESEFLAPSKIPATVISEKVDSDKGLASHFLFKDVDTSDEKETFKDFQEKSKETGEKDPIHSKYLWNTSSTQVKKRPQKTENTKSFSTKSSSKSFSRNRPMSRDRNMQREQHSNDLSFRSIVKTEEVRNQNLWNKFKGFFSSKENSSEETKTYRKPQKFSTSSRKTHAESSSRRANPNRGFSEDTRGGNYSERSRGRTFNESSSGRGRTFSESSSGRGRTFNESSSGRGRTFSESSSGRGRTFSESSSGRGRTFNESSRGRGRTFSESSRGRGRTFSESSSGRSRTFSENKERNFNK